MKAMLIGFIMWLRGVNIAAVLILFTMHQEPGSNTFTTLQP